MHLPVGVGIFILCSIYFLAGASVGDAFYEWRHGHGPELLKNPVLVCVCVLGNVVLISLLSWLWQYRDHSKTITRKDSKLKVTSLLLSGLPVNNRIMFLLGITLWLTGLAVAIAFAVPH